MPAYPHVTSDTPLLSGVAEELASRAAERMRIAQPALSLPSGVMQIGRAARTQPGRVRLTPARKVLWGRGILSSAGKPCDEPPTAAGERESCVSLSGPPPSRFFRTSAA